MRKSNDQGKIVPAQLRAPAVPTDSPKETAAMIPQEQLRLPQRGLWLRPPPWCLGLSLVSVSRRRDNGRRGSFEAH